MHFVALATSLAMNFALFWYVNAVHEYSALGTAADVAIAMLAGLFPWFLAYRKATSDAIPIGTWAFSALCTIVGGGLLGVIPGKDRVVVHSAIAIAAFWASFFLSRWVHRESSDEL